jgi:hypothetical protein
MPTPSPPSTATTASAGRTARLTARPSRLAAC